MIPRKPDEGGVGRRGQEVTDCSQSHIDHRDSENNKTLKIFKIKMKSPAKTLIEYIKLLFVSCIFFHLDVGDIMDPPGSSISWRRTVQRKASQVCCTIVPVLHCTLMGPTPAPRTENTDIHIQIIILFICSMLH